MSALAGHALEIWQGIERHIHLARRAAELVTIDFLEEVARQMLRFDELRECKPRIDTGQNDIRVEFVSVGEHHAFRLPVLDQDLRNS